MDDKEELNKAFIRAVESGFIDNIKAAIEQGADVNYVDDKRSTALHTASFTGSVETIIYLIEHGADIGKHDSSGWTALHVAIDEGYLECMKVLIQHGANLGLEKNGLTALHILARSRFGNEESIKYLINLGADVNAKNNEDQTAEEFALANDNQQTAEIIKNYALSVKEQMALENSIDLMQESKSGLKF